MHISDIVPQKDDNGAPRGLYAGMNGTGKTTLMLKVLHEIRKDKDNFMLIFDTDHMWDYQPYNRLRYKKGVPILIKNVDQLMGFKKGIFIYRPTIPVVDDPMVGKLINYCMKRGDCDIVIDEINDFHTNGHAIDELERAIKQGRKRQVRIQYGAQRTHGIPLICITESKYFFIFFLRNINDRKRLADEVHELLIVPPDLQGHDFWVMYPKIGIPKYVNGLPGNRTPLEYMDYIRNN